MRLLIAFLIIAAASAQTIIPNGQGTGGGGGSVTAGNGISVTGSTVSIDPTYTVDIGRLQSGLETSCRPSGASATAYTCTMATVWPSVPFATGSRIAFRPDVACGATPTLAINGGSAITLKTGTGGAIAANDCAAGVFYTIDYDGTNWRMANVPAPTTVNKQWINFASFDTSTARLMTNGSNTASAGSFSTSQPGTIGMIFPASGTPEVYTSFLITAAITTFNITVDALLDQSAVNGIGTFQVKVAAACVPLGSSRLTPTFSTYTTSVTTTSAFGVLSVQPTLTITPVGTCSAKAMVIIKLQRDKAGSGGVDTSLDRAIVTGALVEY
jgi:hypothetical protein